MISPCSLFPLCPCPLWSIEWGRSMITMACWSLRLYQFNMIPLAKASHVSHPTVKRGDSQVALAGKNLPVSAGDTRDVGSIPGLGRSPGVGSSNSLQYSCLENPMDRGAWWATVQRIAKSRTCLKWLSTWSRQGKVGKKAKFLDKGHRYRERQTMGADNSVHGIGLTSWNAVLRRIPTFQLGSLNDRSWLIGCISHSLWYIWWRNRKLKKRS